MHTPIVVFEGLLLIIVFGSYAEITKETAYIPTSYSTGEIRLEWLRNSNTETTPVLSRKFQATIGL